MKLGLRQTN